MKLFISCGGERCWCYQQHHWDWQARQLAFFAAGWWDGSQPGTGDEKQVWDHRAFPVACAQPLACLPCLSQVRVRLVSGTQQQSGTCGQALLHLDNGPRVSRASIEEEEEEDKDKASHKCNIVCHTVYHLWLSISPFAPSSFCTWLQASEEGGFWACPSRNTCTRGTAAASSARLGLPPPPPPPPQPPPCLC